MVSTGHRRYFGTYLGYFEMMPISDMPLGIFTAAGSLHPSDAPQSSGAGTNEAVVKTLQSGLTQSTMIPSSYSMANPRPSKTKATLGVGSTARKLSGIMMDKFNNQGREIFSLSCMYIKLSFFKSKIFHVRACPKSRKGKLCPTHQP